MLLVEPERQSAPSNRSQWLDRHLERAFALVSELTPTEFRNAEEKYRAVGRWLAAPGSSLAIFAPEVYPQGSMLLGTTVRPYGRSEYDLDLVCQLHWCAQQPPLTIYDWVHGRMAANETYREILEKLKRCLRLNYAGSFHLDVLPACPNDQNRQRLHYRARPQARMLEAQQSQRIRRVVFYSVSNQGRIGGSGPGV